MSAKRRMMEKLLSARTPTGTQAENAPEYVLPCSYIVSPADVPEVLLGGSGKISPRCPERMTQIFAFSHARTSLGYFRIPVHV